MLGPHARSFVFAEFLGWMEVIRQELVSSWGSGRPTVELMCAAAGRVFGAVRPAQKDGGLGIWEGCQWGH